MSTRFMPSIALFAICSLAQPAFTQEVRECPVTPQQAKAALKDHFRVEEAELTPERIAHFRVLTCGLITTFGKAYTVSQIDRKPLLSSIPISAPFKSVSETLFLSKTKEIIGLISNSRKTLLFVYPSQCFQSCRHRSPVELYPPQRFHLI